jgi:hypothetical protein
MMFTMFIAGLALIVILIAGCAGPNAMTREPDKVVASMVMEWSDQARITKECGYGSNGLPVIACIKGYRYIGPKPTDWGDERALLAIGHEFYHALGAEH